jgi:NADPH2:quinone reductase
MARGIVKASIGARFPLARAADAHRFAESRAGTGAIVMLP